MTQTITPLKWHGGKQEIAARIVRMLPFHETYVEPFAGSAAVLWSKRRARIEVMSDVDAELINFYQVLKDDRKRRSLIDSLHATPYSREAHADARLIDDGQGPVRWAWATFVKSHQSFGGQIMGSWAVATKKSACILHSATWVNKIDTLKNRGRRLRDVTVRCAPVWEMLGEYDAPSTVFYCDPPYPGTYQKGYHAGFTQQDFVNLCDRLASLSGRFILSCYPNEYAERMGFAELRILKPIRSSGKKGNLLDETNTEVVYSNAA